MEGRPWSFKTAGESTGGYAALALCVNAWMLVLVLSPSTAAQSSGDFKIDRESCLAQSRARNVKRTPRLPSGLTSWSRLVLLVVIFAIHAGTAESIDFSELPSPKCLWMRLPHAVQVGILLLMVVLLYGLNRFFDRLDEASYARLSRAFSGLAEVRKRVANRQTRER